MAHFLWDVCRIRLLLFYAKKLHLCDASLDGGSGLKISDLGILSSILVDHLWLEQILKRHPRRSLQSSLFYGNRPDPDWRFQYLFWILLIDYLFCHLLGIEWLVSRVGMAALRTASHALVFSKRDGALGGGFAAARTVSAER